MSSDCKVAVVGGGLAGLTAGLALKSAGIEADLFEAAPELGEVGAAISISPQGVKSLQAVGAGDRIVAAANISTGMYTRDMYTGEFLELSDRHQIAVKYGAPYIAVHRADIVDALAVGLEQKRIHLGHRLTGIEQRGDRLMLAFENGARVRADVVIGADGVRSVVRQALYGDDNPTYTGQMIWRALIDGSEVPDDVLEPTGHIQWVGRGRHILSYYIRDRDIVNFVAQQDTDQWVGEGWSTQGNPDELRANFPDCELRLARLFGLINSCTKWGLFTRPLTENWGRGRIQLIGDAAHAMLPNAGQGACQAFEDAYILGRWLEACHDPVEAFANFRRVRIPRVHGVQRLSFSNARARHLRDSAGKPAPVSGGQTRFHGNADWVWGYDPVADWNKEPIVPAAYAT